MYKLHDDFTYHMPAHFGGLRGGLKTVCNFSDVSSIFVTFETEETLLENYVHESFRLIRPEITVQMSMCRSVDFMANGSYNIIQVSSNVAYLKEEGLTGIYPFVVWENCTWPIIGGREETGIPKIYADIEDIHSWENRYFSCASFWCRTFLEIDFVKKRDCTPEEVSSYNSENESVSILGYRYLPNLGGPGAAISHATLYPQGMKCDCVMEGEGSLKWHSPSYFEYHPDQYHIIKALAELPIKRIIGSSYTHGEITLNPPGARALS